MRIVIDLQGAQGENKSRGIGRYAISMAQGIARTRGEHDIFIALNGLFHESIEVIRKKFDGILPQGHLRVWSTPQPANSLDAKNTLQRRAAELCREAFLADLKPDIILVTSLFEGLVDNAITSVGSLHRIPTAVILYDLIPLIYRRPYLENLLVEQWYEEKLGHLRRADLLLAISASSRQEAINYLGFPVEQVVNVGAAADPQFTPKEVPTGTSVDIRKRLGLTKPFVMYTGGIDHRKNIEGLIAAFALLPEGLRIRHQLAIVCKVDEAARTALMQRAQKLHLPPNAIVLTGHIPEDDLIVLYHLCTVFVFPSYHEGFGLPALEAMACGAPVIASNVSSLPDVVGLEEALFDPFDPSSIASKLAQVLIDSDYRDKLIAHGLQQAERFSWDKSARRTIAALEDLHERKNKPIASFSRNLPRPKLAYVSPLPPEKSGISDYSAELLPELSRFYDIEIITDQEEIHPAWLRNSFPIRCTIWLRQNSRLYDRVLYHFGNSHFHHHMFELLATVPGVVVLHDFFLAGIVHWMDHTGKRPGYWIQSLYYSHGYAALEQYIKLKNPEPIIWEYPCNREVLDDALGLIVHSDYSRRLAKKWYGADTADDWTVIPHLRTPALGYNRQRARQALKIPDNDFIFCSFGVLGPTKLNHRLIEAWLASPLANDPHCRLIFVGENHDGAYGANLMSSINRNGCGRRITVTGWADSITYRHYLAAADVSVQLRAMSRGETSGTVLDSMNHGIATIVNANGSMADLPEDAVWMLPDEFSNAELINALVTLWRNEELRLRLAKNCRQIIQTRHSPRACADRYHNAIEDSYKGAGIGYYGAVARIAEFSSHLDDGSVRQLAACMAQNLPKKPPRQLLLDISELVQRDVKSGIQRVVRSILRELLAHPPKGFRVEPVYATVDHGYRYARQFILRFLGISENKLADHPVEFQSGDIFLGLDLQPQVVQGQRLFYQELRNYGVQVRFVVYDLLPILLPEAFVAGASESHQAWLMEVAKGDGAVCISQAVADELRRWLMVNGHAHHREFEITWFHLGADMENSSPTRGVPFEARASLLKLANRYSFLMVGTIEPRKMHDQALTAFEQLWAQGMDINLVIVGKQGWMVETLIERLKTHPELNKRLFWLEGISDEYLEKTYEVATCLIAASKGEGFGLPLIEAAQHKLPIIARDIPVFREVASQHAFYFSGLAPEDLAKAVRDWLELYAQGLAPSSDDIPRLTWRQSVQQLLAAILPAGDLVEKPD
ncbi:glycosyltransferase [Acidithiobacillus caldus]